MKTNPSVVKTSCGTFSEFVPVPENIPDHPSIALYGQRRTGKSTSLVNWIYHLGRDVPFGLVMSNTAFSGFWQTIVPPGQVIAGLNIDVLNWFTQRQQRLIALYGKKDRRSHAFLIMDDVINDQKTMRYNKDVAGFFTNGRHLCISIYICSQYVKGIGPMLRSNVDFVILQPMYDKNQRDALYRLYGGELDRKQWDEVMDSLIVREKLEGSTAAEPRKKVQVMVCATFEDTPHAEEKFFHWTPVPVDTLPKFRLCADVYWNQAKTALTSEGLPTAQKGRDFEEILDELSILQ